jgi:tetratricopeptide (TPR) repeat protein
MESFDRAPGSPLDHALTLRESGDIEGAITLLFKAVAESLTDRGLVITLAKMLSESGKFERAEHWFRHALKIAPDDLDVQLGYGTFLAETGRFAEARVRLESAQRRAQAIAPADDAYGLRELLVVIECNLARVCLELGDFATTRALVTPWLTDEEGWGQAHDVFVDLAATLGLDPIELDEEGLASGHVSPFMVCHRLEQCLEVEPLDLLGFERVVADLRLRLASLRGRDRGRHGAGAQGCGARHHARRAGCRHRPPPAGPVRRAHPGWTCGEPGPLRCLSDQLDLQDNRVTQGA